MCVCVCVCVHRALCTIDSCEQHDNCNMQLVVLGCCADDNNKLVASGLKCHEHRADQEQHYVCSEDTHTHTHTHTHTYTLVNDKELTDRLIN